MSVRRDRPSYAWSYTTALVRSIERIKFVRILTHVNTTPKNGAINVQSVLFIKGEYGAVNLYAKRI